MTPLVTTSGFQPGEELQCPLPSRGCPDVRWWSPEDCHCLLGWLCVWWSPPVTHSGASEKFSDKWNYPYMHIGKFLDPPMQSLHLHIRWLLVVAIPIKFSSLFNIQSCCFILSPPNITEEKPCLWGFTITSPTCEACWWPQGTKGLNTCPCLLLQCKGKWVNWLAARLNCRSR